jgi:hypothetical protein
MAMVMLSAGCVHHENRSKSVYVLVDASIGNADARNLPENVARCLLDHLTSKDTLTMARIDTPGSHEAHLPETIRFDPRPSVMVAQKRVFLNQLAKTTAAEESGRHGDLVGGLLQAIQHLQQTQCARKFVLVAADLNKTLPIDSEKGMLLRMEGIHFIAMALDTQPGTIGAPVLSGQQIERWQARIETGGGKWFVINDLAQLEHIL